MDDARQFHHKIISNRQKFLEREIEHLNTEIQKRKKRIRNLTIQRAEVMEILQSHGALQEFNQLQEGHIAARTKLEKVVKQIAQIKNIKADKRKLNQEKTNLRDIAERDHEERSALWSEAIRLFNLHSQRLYHSPGRLVINFGKKVLFQYKVEIERSESAGINKMKILCFDLAMLQFATFRQMGIKTLIHDSPLYDGVDSRQHALALEQAHAVALEVGGQYICAVNSDMVPHQDFSEAFHFQDHVVLELSDKDPASSLLGFRY